VRSSCLPHEYEVIMKFVSLPLLLTGVAGLLLGGCDNHTTKGVLKDSNPDVSLVLLNDSSSGTVSEAAGEVGAKLIFSENLVNPLIATFTISGNATEGDDFVIQSKSVVVEAQDLAFTGSVYEASSTLLNIIDDSTVDEGDETVNITLSDVSYGKRALPITISLTITENDFSPKPSN
jgi:hypothetical protein